VKKLPSFQFYPGDWLKESGVRMCSPATRGLWIDLLAHMWGVKERGKISGSVEQFCRLLGCVTQEFSVFLTENETQNFANVTLFNGKVTVECRRMVREEKIRKQCYARVLRHRGKDVTGNTAGCNAVVTTASSSSSSSSDTSSKEEGEKRLSPVTVHNRFQEVPKTTPQVDGELGEVLDAWCAKVGRDRTNLARKDFDTWSNALNMHGLRWCLDAIKTASSMYAGVVVVDAEDQTRKARNKNPTGQQSLVTQKCVICQKPASRIIMNDPYCPIHNQHSEK